MQLANVQLMEVVERLKLYRCAVYSLNFLYTIAKRKS